MLGQKHEKECLVFFAQEGYKKEKLWSSREVEDFSHQICNLNVVALEHDRAIPDWNLLNEGNNL